MVRCLLARGLVFHLAPANVDVLFAYAWLMSVLAGNRKMMQENGVDLSAQAEQEENLADQGKTPLYFAQDGALLGMIALADVVKARLAL